MKKKFLLLIVSVLSVVLLAAGCGKDEENVVEETAIVTETEVAEADTKDEELEEGAEEDISAEDETEDEKTEDADETSKDADNVETTEDTNETESDTVSEDTESDTVTDNAGGEISDTEYTADIIAASIPNNNVKMTVLTEGFGMGVSVCDQDVAIMMDLGVSKMDIYSVDNMTYLHGVYENQDVWVKASGADDLTEGYSEDTEEGMKAENIHNISAAVKETKNGKEHDVVTAEVDVEAEDGSTSVSQYKFYIDPQTQKTDYMIYEQDEMNYETTIEEITEIELPEEAQTAEEIGADELAMQMFAFMFASAGESE